MTSETRQDTRPLAEQRLSGRIALGTGGVWGIGDSREM
jgi:hypothetical protein